MQKPECLGDRHGTERPRIYLARIKPVFPPSANRSLVYVGQAQVAECRVEVIAQQALVQLACPDLENAILQPLAGVAAERNAGVIPARPGSRP